MTGGTADRGQEPGQRTGLAVLALSEGGGLLGERLASLLNEATFIPCRGCLREQLTRAWREYEGLICIMASGIVVRTLAPLLEDKRRDPAVVVCDERGRFAISLLSGHLGGGNELARRVAALLGAEAVITTASDVLGRTALDLWARELGLQVAEGQKNKMTRVMGKLVNRGSVSLFSPYPLPELPPDIVLQAEPAKADMLISCRTDLDSSALVLHPPALVAGIGCNRNTPAAEIAQAVEEACRSHHLARSSLCCLASVDLKKDEPGLLEFARSEGCPLQFFGRTALNGVENVSTSAAVLKAIGVKGVAEPAAVLASGGGPLLVRKMKWANVTVALAERRSPFAAFLP